MNYWTGDYYHVGDSARLPNNFDPSNLTVTAYTPYESFNVTDFDYYKKSTSQTIVAGWFYRYLGVLIILLFGAFYYLKKLGF